MTLTPGGEVTATFDDYDTAIRAFWSGRDLQAQKQVESGKADAGTRGSVTAGKHLEAAQDLIANEFEPLVELGAVVRKTGKISVPGYFRQAKDWDIVVTYKDILVAAIECKSQAGSYGNNFNNRTEEAIGNAVDLRHAYKQGLVGSEQPWLGFFFVLESEPGSTQPVRGPGNPVYPLDPAFQRSSYTKRYQLLFERLVKEQHYDAACLISTEKGQGILDEPVDEVSTKHFSAAIAGRVEFIKKLA